MCQIVFAIQLRSQPPSRVAATVSVGSVKCIQLELWPDSTSINCILILYTDDDYYINYCAGINVDYNTQVYYIVCTYLDY